MVSINNDWEFTELSEKEIRAFQSREQKFFQLPRDSIEREIMKPEIEKNRLFIFPHCITSEVLPLLIFHVMIQTRHIIACAPAIRDQIREEFIKRQPDYINKEQFEESQNASMGTAMLGTATRNKIGQLLYQKAAQFDIVSGNMKYHSWYKKGARGIFLFTEKKIPDIKMAMEFKREIDRVAGSFDYPNRIYLCNMVDLELQVKQVVEKISKFVAAKNDSEEYHIYMVFLKVARGLPYLEYKSRLMNALRDNYNKTHVVHIIGGVRMTTVIKDDSEMTLPPRF